MGAPLTIQVFVKGQLRSRLNGSGSRAHWATIRAEARRWSDLTFVAWNMAGSPVWRGPSAVTFTAYVGRLWDDDNLAAAVKHVRDRSVRLILGTDDGPTCGHRFVYKQDVRPPAQRGVLVTVEPLA